MISSAGKVYDYIKKYTPQYITRKRSLLTESERELLPYIAQEKEKAGKQWNLLQPIEALFDLLQRGQYVTANTAEQMWRNYQAKRPLLQDIPREAWEGLTGIQKGDWTNVLFGGQSPGGEQFKGIIPWQPTKPIEKFARGAAGFVANVAFDPTTYIHPFAYAKGAKVAARAYAEDTLALTRKIIEQDAGEVLPKLIQQGAKWAGKDITYTLNKVYKEAYKQGLRQPAEKLTKEITEKALNLKNKLLEGISEKYAGAKPTLAKLGQYYTEQAGEPLKFLTELAEKVQTVGYPQAGTRAVRVLGQELFRGERYPLHTKVLDELQARFKKSKIGGLFSDAWWALNNNPRSPVTLLRQAFGIRNPYQHVLNVYKQDIGAARSAKMLDEITGIRKVIEPLTDIEKNQVFTLMAQTQTEQQLAGRAAEEVAKKALKTGVAPPVPKIKRAIERAGETLGTQEADNVKKAVTAINEITGKWSAEFTDARAKGLVGDIGEILDYMPIQEKRTLRYQPIGAMAGPSSGFMKQRKMTWPEHIKRQIDIVKWKFGLDDIEAEKLVSGNLSDLNVDLQDMFTRRALAQYRWKQRIDMVEQFRTFGFDTSILRETNPEAYLYFQTHNIEELGLKPISSKGLEGYLFDKDVAGILNKVVQVSSNDEALRGLSKALWSATSVWKGWATLSPGFHMRNMFSNELMLLMKQGPISLNPSNKLDAIICTARGLYGDKAPEYLSKFGLSKEIFAEKLARQIGGLTHEQLIDYAKVKGVISQSTMAFDIPSTEGMLKGRSWNPLSPGFIPMKGSRTIGNLVESTPRMQSFLMDFKELVKKGSPPEQALEFAKNEAKKWFIDYTDLTEFERKWMKNIVPFYTWMRYNIPNQLIGMMQFHDMYTTIPKLQQAVSGGKKVSGEEMPDWMREMGMFPVGATEGGPLMFWPNFGYMDINKIPLKFRMTEGGIPLPVIENLQDFKADIISSSHPMLKTFVENVSEPGWDVFFQKSLGETERAPRLTRIFSKSPKLLLFIDGLMRTVGYENGLRAQLDKKGRLLIDARTVQLLENNLPLLTNIPKYWDLPEIIFPALEKFKEKVTGAKDDYEGLEDLLQTLSFYGGIKFKKLNLEEEQTTKMREILRKAQAARANEMRKSPIYEKRRMQYINKSLKQRRRLGLG